jgi:transcriptional regulator CtsR
MHIITSIGDKLSQHTCEIFIQNFMDYDIIDEQEAGLMKAATSDKALAAVAPNIRDEIRMTILKNMLMSLVI